MMNSSDGRLGWVYRLYYLPSDIVCDLVSSLLERGRVSPIVLADRSPLSELELDCLDRCVGRTRQLLLKSCSVISSRLRSEVLPSRFSLYPSILLSVLILSLPLALGEGE